MKRVNTAIAMMLAIVMVGACAAVQASAPDPVKERIAYKEAELSKKGVSVEIEVDRAGIEEYKSLNNTLAEKDKRLSFLVDQAAYAFEKLAAEPELREAIGKDVRKIRIVHDPKLAEEGAIDVRNGLASMRFNYSAFSASARSTPLFRILEQSLPSAVEAQWKKQKKHIEDRLKYAGDTLRKNELLDVAFDVRWEAFQGQDEKVMRGLERCVDEARWGLENVIGHADGKAAVTQKVRQVSFGLLQGKATPAAIVSLEKGTLYLALPVETLRDHLARMNFLERFREVLGVKPPN